MVSSLPFSCPLGVKLTEGHAGSLAGAIFALFCESVRRGPRNPADHFLGLFFCSQSVTVLGVVVSCKCTRYVFRAAIFSPALIGCPLQWRVHHAPWCPHPGHVVCWPQGC